MSHDQRNVIQGQSRESLLHTEGEKVDGIFPLCVSPACGKWLENLALEFICTEQAHDPRPVCSPDNRCSVSLPEQLLCFDHRVNTLEKGGAFFAQIDRFQVLKGFKVSQIPSNLRGHTGFVVF